MHYKTSKQTIKHITAILGTIMLLTSCDRSSSPEGRMNMKLESLQKEMIDSLQQQNKAILDSLSSMRADIQKLQEQAK